MRTAVPYRSCIHGDTRESVLLACVWPHVDTEQLLRRVQGLGTNVKTVITSDPVTGDTRVNYNVWSRGVVRRPDLTAFQSSRSILGLFNGADSTKA